MKKIFFNFLLLIVVHLNAFHITGQPKNWNQSDFIGFDKIGDKQQKFGDISSLFAKKISDTLFVRITFDDMNLRKHNKYIN